MAPRISARIRLFANPIQTTTTTILPRPGPTSSSFLISRTTKRHVQYGWDTTPHHNKHHNLEYRPQTEGLPALTTGPDAALARKEATTPPRTGVLAIKKGMSAVFRGKKRIPCTVLQLDRVQVVAQRTREKHGYWGLQVGLGARLPVNVDSAQLGYYEAKGMAPKTHLAEFRVKGEDGLLPVGVQLQPDWFAPGQYVDVRSNTRGMGFAGGMKRWGFKGQEASHGNSRNHRTIGSVGPSQGSGSRVLPGKKMPGRMGGQRVTVQNLKVMEVNNEIGVVVVSGPIGGPKGCVVQIQDAIKKKDVAPVTRERILKSTLERNPDVSKTVNQARMRHLELQKERRKVAELNAIARQKAEKFSEENYVYR